MPLGLLPDLSGAVAEGTAGCLERIARTESGARLTFSAHGQQAGAGFSIHQPSGIGAVAAITHSREPGSKKPNATCRGGRAPGLRRCAKNSRVAWFQGAGLRRRASIRALLMSMPMAPNTGLLAQP